MYYARGIFGFGYRKELVKILQKPILQTFYPRFFCDVILYCIYAQSLVSYYCILIQNLCQNIVNIMGVKVIMNSK